MTSDANVAASHRANAERYRQSAERYRKLRLTQAERDARAAALFEDKLAEILLDDLSETAI